MTGEWPKHLHLLIFCIVAILGRKKKNQQMWVSPGERRRGSVTNTFLLLLNSFSQMQLSDSQKALRMVYFGL